VGNVDRIVTVSASYGTGGSVVAPAVAEALGFPFLDRAVQAGPAAIRDSDQEAASDEERTGGLWARVLETLAAAPTDAVPTSSIGVVGTDETLRINAEARLREFVAGSEGVILGWASALVVPDAYHVRLDGPLEARLRQGMAIGGRLGEADARRQLEQTDRIRSLYWRRLYKRDIADPSLYHLAVDSTAIDLGVVRDLIILGARAFWEAKAG